MEILTFTNCCRDLIEIIAYLIAPFVEIVEIACNITSWIIFLIYLISYSQKDITGYEYYNNNIFVFEGSDPRERVSELDCEYIEKESTGNSLVSYLNYFSKEFLVAIGIVWLIFAGIFIVFLIIYLVK